MAAFEWVCNFFKYKPFARPLFSGTQDEPKKSVASRAVPAFGKLLLPACGQKRYTTFGALRAKLRLGVWGVWRTYYAADEWPHQLHPPDQEHARCFDYKAARWVAQVHIDLVGLCFFAKTLSAHVWLECVIMCLQPFNIVENNMIPRHLRNNLNSVDSLLCYMQALRPHVGCNILAMLPDKLIVVFDGWCAGDIHFVASFARYRAVCTRHFRKSWKVLAVIFNDKWSTKKAIARRVGPLFVDCFGQWYKLAMKYILCESAQIVEHVQSLIRRF